MNCLNIKFILTWVLFKVVFNSLNAQMPAVTLNECLKKAREYHPYYSDKQRIDETRELKIKNINSAWLPQAGLNAQATYQSDATRVNIRVPGIDIPGTPLDQYRLAVDLNQVLFDGGVSNAMKLLTNASVYADLQQNEADLYKVNEQVLNAYFTTLLLQISMEIYKNTLDDLASKEQKVSSGVRNGILFQNDLDNLKVEILKTGQLLNEIQLAYAGSRQVLFELTGDSLMFTADLMVPEISASTDDSVRRPEVKYFDLQKDILNGSKKVSSSQRLPRLMAFSQLGYGRPGLNMLDNDFKSYYFVGLKLQWNIWDWNKAGREKSIYSVQQEMIDSKKESYLRNIHIISRNELTRTKQLENALAADEEILNLRKSITRQSEKRLDQGVITMTDYLTDYNAELKAGLQFETHKIQFLQSKANYLVINGQL